MNARSREPTFHSLVIQELINALFRGDDQRQAKELTRLGQANLQHNPGCYGFLFGGTFYTPWDRITTVKTPKKPIANELQEEASAFHEAQIALNNVKARLTTGLSLLLRTCKTWQDVRDALPDTAKDELEALAVLRRTRPAGYPLLDNPLTAHQVDEIFELISFPIANRFLL